MPENERKECGTSLTYLTDVNELLEGKVCLGKFTEHYGKCLLTKY